MTIIHIHLDDNDEALATIAVLLNQGFHVTVDLDEMSDDAVVEDVETIFKREETEIVAAGRVDKRITDPARRQAIYDQRWTDVQVARNVACPSCKALIDWPCTTPGGKAYGNFAHIERIQNGYNLKNGVL